MNTREFKRITANQFMDVWNHYDTDGTHKPTSSLFGGSGGGGGGDCGGGGGGDGGVGGDGGRSGGLADAGNLLLSSLLGSVLFWFVVDYWIRVA